MLVDGYIVHLLEAQLEGQEEKAYSSRLEERRKDSELNVHCVSVYK